MKDVKITTLRPVAEPTGKEKAARKENVAGPSFKETLEGTIARVNDLSTQAGASLQTQGAKAATIGKEISTAHEIYEKMMLEKQNLSRLYHHIKNPEESS